MKNECKTEDMIEILDVLHKYAPLYRGQYYRQYSLEETN